MPIVIIPVKGVNDARGAGVKERKGTGFRQVLFIHVHIAKHRVRLHSAYVSRTANVYTGTPLFTSLAQHPPSCTQLAGFPKIT